MKYILSLVLLLVSYSVLAESPPCNGNLEAQIIAQYDHLDLSYAEAGNFEHTSFGLKNFRFYSENASCPLNENIAELASITEYRLMTEVSDGEEVSGILIYNPRTRRYFLENK